MTTGRINQVTVQSFFSFSWKNKTAQCRAQKRHDFRSLFSLKFTHVLNEFVVTLCCVLDVHNTTCGGPRYSYRWNP